MFGKDKMATFERYFIEDKESHKETKNCYYSMLDREEILNKILEEFGLDTKKSHIINGHVPVELKKGETPIKCDGKLLIIDGGFSKAYRGIRSCPDIPDVILRFPHACRIILCIITLPGKGGSL